MRGAALALALAGLLAACAAPPRLAAQGELAGERIETTVDSPIARHYLERYLRGERSDPAMDGRIDAIHRRFPSPSPSREELAEIARATSVDFATLFLAQRLLADACNRAANAAFARLVAAAEVDPRAARRYLLLFVPGWDYVANGPATGADFARQRELATRLGFEARLAALRPTGSIEENAAILAAEIDAHARSGRELILASASSAGPTVHLALGERFAQGRRGTVAAWINIGGILQGSPIVEHLLLWPQRAVFEIGVRWKGWERDAVIALGTTAGRARFARLRLDPELAVVSYVGIPLSGQVGPHAASNYAVLAREGPNDGLTLLADAIAPGGPTILAPGRDHFFAGDPRGDEKSAALMALMVRYAATPPGERCTPAGR